VLSWSLLEALALECVVVASDTGPVREVIRNGQNGLLVPFFDREALAGKIIDVLAAPERFASLGKRARTELVRDFSFEGAVLPRYMALIDDLLSGGAGASS
jgi:glycosyltransferase involved in cell wall biosynthesis